MTQCGRLVAGGLGEGGVGGQTEEGGEGASALDDDDVCTVSDRLAGSWRGRWKEEVGANLAKSMKPEEAGRRSVSASGQRSSQTHTYSGDASTGDKHQTIVTIQTSNTPFETSCCDALKNDLEDQR